MNLYLKYRPKTIEELDLSQVRKALLDIVKANQVSHAYLLTGPRGAGKTSTARILARIVNCERNGKKLGEPCNECSACKSITDGSALDVIEIDAASNRGIDDIRELKEKIRLAPSTLRHKVYIIDEVHMLTSEAFNALLKTLEEPPKHSLFILCTTETHKVPETIISRCTRIAFTKATPEEMVRSFSRVLRGEGAEASEEALRYLGGAVDGSFRDGVKVLDQIIAGKGEVSLAKIQEALLGVAGFSAVPFAQALVNKEAESALLIYRESNASGLDLTHFITAGMEVLREALVAPYTGENNPMGIPVGGETVNLVYKLDETLRKALLSPVPAVLIEAMIVEWCDDGGQRQATPGKRTPQPPAKKPNGAKETELQSENASLLPKLDGEEVWRQIISGVGEGNYALGTLLSKAKPGKIQGNELTVYVEYDFHRQQLMVEKMRAKFEELISQAVGRPMKVVCVVAPEARAVPPSPAVADDIMDEALTIFNS